MDFFSNVELSLEQVQCICRGMHTVAITDGMHPREEELMREFYDSCRGSSAPSFEDVVRQPFSSAEALGVLRTPEHRRLFIKTLWLLAFADGKTTAPERDLIARYAQELGVPEAESLELQAQVKEFLLAQLSHIKNTQAVAEVSRQMKLF